MTACTHLCIAIFMLIRVFDHTTQLRRHGLHAVADTQHRYTTVKHDLRCLRRITSGNRFRPAGQDKAHGFKRTDILDIHIVGIDLTIHAEFAHASCNQLGVLGTEIQDQEPVSMNVVIGSHDIV